MSGDDLCPVVLEGCTQDVIVAALEHVDLLTFPRILHADSPVIRASDNVSCVG
jgi:hypothetical protein